jgi:hypothetical protein
MTDELERGHAVVIASHSFAIDDAGARAQACQRLDDQREATREVVARTAIEPHPLTILASNDAEAVMLDLVQPLPARRAAGAHATAARAVHTAAIPLYIKRGGVRGVDMIGKIVRRPLREVWRHEALDFTTWLIENIDVWSEALDLPLQDAKREQAAGDFNVDLVAEDDSGSTVVIENQLEKSNHDQWSLPLA